MYNIITKLLYHLFWRPDTCGSQYGYER